MKLLRKILFWLHLTAGSVAGLVILIMSVTGVLLAYERQITYWADTREFHVAPPSQGATRLPVESLLARFGESQPGAAITSVTMRAGANEPSSISLAGNPGSGPGSGRVFFVNPYTGDTLGEGSRRTHDFFHTITDWHRWLGADGASRNVTRGVTGACNLGFLFIVASGIYLWWPRKRNWSQFKNILWFKRGLPGKARDFNWHNVIGFWSFAPLFIIALSGVVISYQWAGNLVYRAVGEIPPARPTQPGQTPGNPGQRRGGMERRDAGASVDNLDGLWSRAAQQVAGWRSISLRMPASSDAPLTFTIDQGDGGQPQNRSQLTLDRKTGDVVRWEPFSQLTTGRRLRSYLRFAHTGELAGLSGQTIAGLASLGAGFLVWTGISLAFRRLLAWLGRRDRVTVQRPDPLVETATGD